MSQKAVDSMKRYSYLLGQTDLFGEFLVFYSLFPPNFLLLAHFINLRTMRGSDILSLNEVTENAKNKSASSAYVFIKFISVYQLIPFF